MNAAIHHHANMVRYYANLLEREALCADPDKYDLLHYIESIDAHMRMASNAALSREALCAEGG